MLLCLFRVFLVFIVFGTGAIAAAPPNDIRYSHHELAVTVVPAQHYLQAEATVSFSREQSLADSVRFFLNAGLAIESADPGFVVAALPGVEQTGSVPLRAYTLRPAAGAWPEQPRVRLRWSGEIDHPLVSRQENYARSYERTPGIISEDGVMLSGSSYWVPWFGEQTRSFDLTVNLPQGWDAVSTGERLRHEESNGARRVTWRSTKPLDDIYLIANRFTEYHRQDGDLAVYAFLRAPDAKLAEHYLGLTAVYVDMYRQLVGEYPYKKFALVENFWETGYGMPSFTLLGPRVIRLPFIPYTSYPHEILHNWWGNSVFVDYASGNWAEGLTSYLADHLLKEQRGGGADYRRDALKGYLNFVRAGGDFPLVEFRARHSSASQAVGYGKGMMLFHMLRRRLGDEVFSQGLRHFYDQNRFRQAAFADLEAAFSAVADEDLAWFFRQWAERTGAPELSLRVEALDQERVTVTVRQEQPGEPYRLRVPLAVTIAGEAQARLYALNMTEQEASLEIKAAVSRVDLDPEFDLFRRLAPAEIPPSLSALFGAERVVLVLPQGGDSALSQAWRELAAAWSQRASGQVRVVEEQALEKLPQDSAVWILGNNNRWREMLQTSLDAYGAGVRQDEITVAGERLPAAGHSFVFTTRHPADPALAIGWIGADGAGPIAGLARKLPHYGKYSYLVFAGAATENRLKGQWPVLASPLVVAPGGRQLVERAVLPERAPLARLP